MPVLSRAHFLHIGKTAGTAVKTALRPHAFQGDRVLVLHKHVTRLVDVPEGEQFFFSVRDPIDRYVSAFNSRQRRGRPLNDNPWSESESAAFARFPTANDLAEALGDDAAAERAMHGIGHVQSSYWDWFGDESAFLSRLPDLLMVLRQERLADDFDVLREVLGVPLASLPADEVAAHRTPAGTSTRHSDVGRARIADWYEADFRFLALCDEVARERGW